MKKVAYFFGAGAEVNLGMPSGLDFFRSTLPRESKLKNSKIDMILDALNEYYSDKKIYDDKDLHHLKHIPYYQESVNNKEGIDYCILEKYFHTLINPNTSKINFWKIINFYWLAYFSIVSAITEDKSINIELKTKEDYLLYLRNLKSSSKKIHRYCSEKKDTGYYNRKYYQNKNIETVGIITTNYTNFCETTGIENNRIAFLAGKLDYFENPYRLDIFGSEKINKNRAELIFPFILAQTSVKPIIHPYQIEEYNKYSMILDDAEYLVIIGYALNKDDNHINSYIRDFLINNINKKLIYCHYTDKGNFNIKKIEYKLLKKLKCNQKKNLIILKNSGEPDIILSKIEEVIINDMDC